MAAWDFIATIAGRHNLLSKEEIEMKPGRVSDLLVREAGVWFCSSNSYGTYNIPKPILIKAPTGSGKSTFIMRDLAEIFKPAGRILLLTNRKALCLQQRVIGNSNSEIQRLGFTALSGNPIWDNMDIITYQEAISYIKRDWYGTLNDICVGVCDEAHFFYDDSTYNAHTSEILKLLIPRFFWQKRIYMTATPEDVLPLILYEEKNQLDSYILQVRQQRENAANFLRARHQEEQKTVKETNGNMAELTKRQTEETNNFNNKDKIDLKSEQTVMANQALKVYNYPDDFSHVRLHFFHEWMSIVNTVKENENKDKWLIFVRTKEKGEELKKQFGSCADFFDADSKGDDKKALNDLLRREYFEKTVLISTTLLYNGVNFNDNNLKHIVVDTVNELEMIQMLGRKRINGNEIVNLYVMVPKEKDLNTYLNLTRRNLQLIKSFQRNPNCFFRDTWERGNIDENFQKLFAISDDWMAPFIKISQYADYKLGLEEGRLETCLDLIKMGNSWFEQDICSRFHITYSPEMQYDKPLDALKEQIKKSLIPCFEKHMAKSPFPSQEANDFWMELASLLTPHAKILGLKLRGEKEKSRRKADINKISEYFELPYFLPNSDGKMLTLVKKDKTSNNPTKVIQHSDINNKSTT